MTRFTNHASKDSLYSFFLKEKNQSEKELEYKKEKRVNVSKLSLIKAIGHQCVCPSWLSKSILSSGVCC